MYAIMLSEDKSRFLGSINVFNDITSNVETAYKYNSIKDIKNRIPSVVACEEEYISIFDLETETVVEILKNRQGSTEL